MKELHWAASSVIVGPDHVGLRRPYLQGGSLVNDEDNDDDEQ